MTEAMAQYFLTRFAKDQNHLHDNHSITNDYAPISAHRSSSTHTHYFTQALSQVLTDWLMGNTTSPTPQPFPCDAQWIIDFKQAQQGQVAPLISDGKQLWLHRCFMEEQQLADALLMRLNAPSSVSDAPSLSTPAPSLNAEQQRAIKHALSASLTFINGGPGTGKTYTIATLLTLLLEHAPTLNIALAAPTGKAAKRMNESLQQALNNTVGSIPEAQTLHRLLGIGTQAQPFYHKSRRLPYELLIIDEASMLSLSLANQVFAALKEECKVILLGDAYQLAAVEAGAIFRDLTTHPRLDSSTITLRHTQRYADEAGIGQLAAHIRHSYQLDAQTAQTQLFELLTQHQEICWHEEMPNDFHAELFKPYQRLITQLKQQESAETLLETLNSYRILSSGHHGAFGTIALNEAMRKQACQALNLPINTQMYHGLPLMVSANDYHNQLYNGDIGLCLADETGALALHLPNRAPIALSRLNVAQLETAYAMSIHKSQGSEFNHAAVLLDAQHEKLLSRELFYTAISRAKTQLSLYATRQALAHSISRHHQRSTGLHCFL